MSLAAGTRFGPYEILAPLGAGGMGEVYRARDTRLDRDVAIKVLPAVFAQDADRRARFEREAKAIAALSHPNILAIHDIETTAGQTYVVTELLDGETVRDRLKTGALPVRQAIDIAVQIARGLAALAPLACLLLGASAASAQDNATTVGDAIAVQAPAAPTVKGSHPFWDTTNLALVGGVAASRAMDFASTGHFRALGDHEWLLTNGIVDDKPLFATIEVAAVAVSIGVSYLFHRTQHHTLERWVSVLHIGVTVGGAIHNYSLKAPGALIVGIK